MTKKDILKRQLKLKAFLIKKYPNIDNLNLYYNMMKGYTVYDIRDVIIWSIIIIEYKNRATDYIRL